MKRAIRSKPIIVTVGNVMVRIYKVIRPSATGKRITFEIADYTAGKRKFRVFASEADARKEAGVIAQKLSTGDAVGAAISSAQASTLGRVTELLRPFNIPLEIAVATYVQALQILGGDRVIEASKFFERHRADKITPRTVAATVNELLAAKEARGKSDRYIADLRARLTRFAKDFAVDIGSVTASEVQAWIDGLKAAPQTAKNYRTVLFTLFSFAESRGYIIKGSNPAEDTESISTNGTGAIEIYTPTEISKLLKAARVDFLPVLALGAFAGIRVAEIERMEWKDIDFDSGFIHVAAEKAKTRSRRLVPIQPNLALWLNSIPNRKGRIWKGTPDTLREMRSETVKSADVAWKDNALRHSYISYRLAEIQDAAKVSLEAGNSPQMVFQHYRELVKPEIAKDWFGIVPGK